MGLNPTAQNFIKLGVTSQKVSKSYKKGKEGRKSDYYTRLYNYTRLLIQAEKDLTCFAFIL
jgi:hypothetical protein